MNEYDLQKQAYLRIVLVTGRFLSIWEMSKGMLHVLELPIKVRGNSGMKGDVCKGGDGSGKNPENE